jgi:hypothetical protein
MKILGESRHIWLLIIIITGSSLICFRFVSFKRLLKWLQGGILFNKSKMFQKYILSGINDICEYYKILCSLYLCNKEQFPWNQTMMYGNIRTNGKGIIPFPSLIKGDNLYPQIS